MSLLRLVLREIMHRKINFTLGILSVSVAVGCLVGALTVLSAHEIRTRAILESKQAEVEQAIAAKQLAVEEAGKELEDSMRKITKGLGFNILILPQDQDLNEFYVAGKLTRTMPEEYVERLAESDIVTINHLLPQVTRTLEWPEMGRTIILNGTRGEVGSKKAPLQDPVPAGEMVLGYRLHRELKLSQGDEVALLGKKFRIGRLHEERGTSDDGTVWINLREAQELLGMENLLNAILALECNCATVDRIGEIRSDIARILPGTQVIESGSKALARAEARNKARAVARAALQREQEAGAEAVRLEQEGRAELGRRLEQFTAVIVPLVLVGCAVWIGLLAFGNVRERRGEIGVLRAIGLRSRDILSIFLAKAVLIGVVGAAVGYAAGFTIGGFTGDLGLNADSSRVLFTPVGLLLAVLLAPVLAGLASWIPALLAAQQDPAIVLAEE